MDGASLRSFVLWLFWCFDSRNRWKLCPGFEFKTVTTNVECTCIKIRVPAYLLPHGVVMQIIVQQPMWTGSKQYISTLNHKTNHKYFIRYANHAVVQ